MKKLVSSIGLSVALSATYVPASHAGTDAYIGEVFYTAATFCPTNTMDAAGQLLPISQYQATFALLGTTYGGDGIQTFALPDLRGRVPVGIGQGQGLPAVQQGEMSGSPSITLTINNLPTHTHSAGSLSGNVVASKLPGDTATTAGKMPADGQRAAVYGAVPVQGTDKVDMAAGTVKVTGGSTGIAGNNMPFDNHPPYLGIRACIVINGIFPSRP